MTKTIDKDLSVLEQHEVKTNWKEKAQWRRENRRWLRYSGFIALKVMHRLEDLNMSQKELAERMNCSPQYVSKLLKGSENLTLETIAKLEDLLGLIIIKDALTHTRYYDYKDQPYRYLSEPNAPKYGSKGLDKLNK